MKHLLAIFIIILTFSANAQTGLKGTSWVMTKIVDKKAKTSLIINNEHATLRFDDTTYAGYGCNAFSGKYKATSNKINFLGGMHITDNGCGAPDDYKAENYVLQNFMQLEYKLSGETLTLNKDNEVIFTYIKQTQK